MYSLQEKEKLFQFFDEDGNGLLDRAEMGKLNAYLFNMFPRFGYKGTEPPGEIAGDCRGIDYIALYYIVLYYVIMLLLLNFTSNCCYLNFWQIGKTLQFLSLL